MQFQSKGYGSFYEAPQEKEDIEAKVAKELQRMKLENQSKQRHLDKVCKESEEIRAMKEKINQAYLNKQRAAQISENQTRKIQEIQRDAEIDDLVLQQAKEFERKVQEQEAERRANSKFGADIMLKQMEEKKHKAQEAHEQYLKERDQVNTLVNNIVEQDKQEMLAQQSKKQKAFNDMIEALDEKQQQKIESKRREEEENRQYLEHMKKVEKREEDFKAQKAEIEAAKDKIYRKIKAEQEAKQKERELLEDLRFELQQEEFDANERRKDREELEKRIRHKELMIQAERDDYAMKQARKAEEDRIEGIFRKNMMDKFREDERLEQLSQQKRRMKELQFKKDIEDLWQQKLAVYRAEKDREQAEERRKQAEEQVRLEIIQEEKERLLKEHLPMLNGFIPKGLLGKPEDSRYLKKTGF